MFEIQWLGETSLKREDEGYSMMNIKVDETAALLPLPLSIS